MIFLSSCNCVECFQTKKASPLEPSSQSRSPTAKGTAACGEWVREWRGCRLSQRLTWRGGLETDRKIKIWITRNKLTQMLNSASFLGMHQRSFKPSIQVSRAAWQKLSTHCSSTRRDLLWDYSLHVCSSWSPTLASVSHLWKCWLSTSLTTKQSHFGGLSPKHRHEHIKTIWHLHPHSKSYLVLPV